MLKLKKFLNILNCSILKIREFFKLNNYNNFGKVANIPNYKFLEFYKLQISGIF